MKHINFNNVPDGTLTGEEVFGEKTVLVFGLPGAFTPTCSTKQLPTYDEMYDQFIDKGIDEVYCTSVNDGFVMKSWFESQEIKNVKYLSDGNGEFAAWLGMLVSKCNLGFGQRSWRYAAIIKDGIISDKFVEDGMTDNHDQDPYEISTPENVLAQMNND
jgi:peroxiredoxin